MLNDRQPHIKSMLLDADTWHIMATDAAGGEHEFEVHALKISHQEKSYVFKSSNEVKIQALAVVERLSLLG